METLADIGEDRLISALLDRLPPGVRAGDDIIAAAGDDCAVLRVPGAVVPWQLCKTDCVIEGVHYLPETAPGRVGWKALCRPLSDFAAMGGVPSHALITLALPPRTTVGYACALYTGLGRAAERFGVRIVGGETARSPAAAFLSVALIGAVDPAKLVLRSGGQPGDSLYVTGRLGGSYASGKHLDFIPRLEEAQWLVSLFRPRAMMDLSDGLARDLPRMAAACGTGWAVNSSRLPLSAGCDVAQAIGDGEDYELLFTLDPLLGRALEEAWRTRWPTLDLTRIGALASPTDRTGLEAAIGFEHFAAED